MDDTSLNAFLDDESVDAGKTADDESVDAGKTVTPAVSTYTWSPEKEPCEACGTQVRQRWQDDAGLVCRECKTW